MRGKRLAEVAAVVAGAGAAALIGAHEVVTHFGQLGVANDWDLHLHWYWVARESVARFHQFPLWNPWACGGTPLLGDAESAVWTPMFLLQLALGIVKGSQVEIVLHLAVAVAGGYVLGRTLDQGRWGAAAVGLFFAGSSWFAAHLAEGHGWALTYAYVPWTAAALLLAFKRNRLLPAALAGAVLALMVGEGGIYPAPHTVLLLGILTLFALGRRRRQPLLALAVCGVIALLLAAPKLGPVLDLLRQNPRRVPSHESMTLGVLWQALFGWHQDFRTALPHDRWYWGYQEYSAFIGPVVALCAAVGAVVRFRRAGAWICAALVFVALAMGDVTSGLWKAHPTLPLSPWALLHALPLFSSQHVPSRFLVMFVLCVAVLAGYGIQALAARLGKWGPAAALALIATGFAVHTEVGAPNLRHMFEGSPPVVPTQPAFRQLYASTDRVMLPLAEANLGALHCYDFGALRAHAHASNRPGYRGEVWLNGPGTVALSRWSPNALSYDVTADHPETLFINQNYDAPWRVRAGQGTVKNERGLLAVSVPAGEQHLELAYVSRHFQLGLALFALGVSGVLGLFIWERRRARR